VLHHLDLRRLDVGLLGDDLADTRTQVTAAARTQLFSIRDIVLDALARQAIVIAPSTSASLNSCPWSGSAFSELAPNRLCAASRNSSLRRSISNACSRTSAFSAAGSSGRSVGRGEASSMARKE
jgi:hypothetical protein